MIPAVHGNVLPGNVRSGIREQETHGLYDFFRRGPTSHRNPRQHAITKLLAPDRLGHGSLDDAEANGIRPNAREWSKFGARTGLTGFVAGLARSVAEHNVTINNLLPGTFDTDRLKSNLAALAKNSSREVREVTEEIRVTNPTKRFGHPDEFGAACAFLCSAQAGYITGQSLLIDGGAYPGTF
ncbi:SDR family oxidoreductase [Bradyrhizobium sp. WSM 1738]|nr:SDR family oxidoreductase [Bradyrhizobium hereditatis]